MGAMREEMGVPLDVAILLVPGGRELDDEMLLGEIVRDGLMTVELRCQGVGGGKAEDEASGEAACFGQVKEVSRLLEVGANINSTRRLLLWRVLVKRDILLK
eukprot:CAMPEP_0175961132 /NCGR_PEP_ID=MMETSP0108-20121206/35761_1 /TAXON_ID=195067 ORGANISM="Goniomonas pacifica, Strain CCMP1869" /NCGR_SAMPLE_ID=MMETSP0108 /ASSEMBLY_ACC=CAM_ASM_000204 /LENGTH=101 /DNA_ID=CAMNT_0017288819 /DNA_START=285 /DNA_END=587 /DNA_ORIENTATION=+